jgi:hypothetical protein
LHRYLHNFPIQSDPPLLIIYIQQRPDLVTSTPQSTYHSKHLSLKAQLIPHIEHNLSPLQVTTTNQSTTLTPESTKLFGPLGGSCQQTLVTSCVLLTGPLALLLVDSYFLVLVTQFSGLPTYLVCSPLGLFRYLLVTHCVLSSSLCSL